MDQTRFRDNICRIRSDLYTSRHCQWYYFRVQNMRADCEYRFSFVNLSKPDSQYSVGMKPVLYSEIEAQNGVGWTRVGSEMVYFKDAKSSDPDKPSQYVMSFTMTFPHENDTCYLVRVCDLTLSIIAGREVKFDRY